MIETIHFPHELKGAELDYYLSIGWYRMGQTVFTTHFIPVKDKIHRVYWIRIRVQEVEFGKRQRRLLAMNRQLSMQVKPFYPGDELDELYALYRSAVNFDAPHTIASFLLNEQDTEFRNIYDSQVIELRDGEQLVAAGIFDNGENSIAGIMNFYHPDYAYRSPGKYLMLLKINLARETGRLYYYPGYVVSGFPKFDYKLFPDSERTEWYEPVRNEWISFADSPYPDMPGFDLHEAQE
jgi:arginine-tRNA-protein transferase